MSTKKSNLTKIVLGAATVTAATTVGVTAHADTDTGNNQATDTGSAQTSQAVQTPAQQTQGAKD